MDGEAEKINEPHGLIFHLIVWSLEGRKRRERKKQLGQKHEPSDFSHRSYPRLLIFLQSVQPPSNCSYYLLKGGGPAQGALFMFLQQRWVSPEHELIIKTSTALNDPRFSFIYLTEFQPIS